MDIRQLRYFVAVAEEGRFTAAAKRVNVTQPPVTRQIQALEQELRVQLFTRTARGASLTDAGKVFLAEARQILERTERAGERCRAADRGELGHLAVAFFGSPVYRTVPLLLRRYRSDFPGIEISLVRLSKRRQLDALRTGVIDIGFSRYYPASPGVTMEVVAEERLFVALRQEDRPKHSLTLADLGGRPIVLFPSGERPSFADAVMSLLQAAGVVVSIGGEAEDATAALALVSIGAGLCVVPESVAETTMPGVVFMPLKGQRLVVPVHCVYLKENPSKALRSFLSTLTPLRS